MIVVQLAINGILLGGVLALSALGFNIVFGVMRVVNLAHGDFVVLAAVFAAYAFAQFGVNPLLLLPVTVAAGLVAGALVHQLLRRLPGEIASAEASSLTLTFGLSYFLAGAGLATFGGRFVSVPYLTGAFQAGPLSIPQARLLAFVVAVVLSIAFGFVLRATRIGRAIRATSQNLDGALACGVDVGSVRTAGFAIGTAVATAAGTLMSFLYNLNVQQGVLFTVNAFAVVVIGGLGNYTGAILGALILGLTESFASYYAGATLAEAAPYLLFILVLLVAPNGILGRRTA
ncbi:MAG TPA: branched-chain amino acid ABC transporter permease [Candidatus Elarobacter sp.]|jgi:branched-chain amino acid transport system permease protein|nr:branched-chain amino acid ABC transporter permease [Candidatus Elarobacter sp.]